MMMMNEESGIEVDLESIAAVNDGSGDYHDGGLRGDVQDLPADDEFDDDGAARGAAAASPPSGGFLFSKRGLVLYAALLAALFGVGYVIVIGGAAVPSASQSSARSSAMGADYADYGGTGGAASKSSKSKSSKSKGSKAGKAGKASKRGTPTSSPTDRPTLSPTDFEPYVPAGVLTASDAESGDQYGFSVAVFEELISPSADEGRRSLQRSGAFKSTYVVGSPGKNSQRGAVYVRRNDASNTNGEVRLVANDRAVGDLFGKSVGIYGKFIVVGAPNDDDKGSNSGSAYIFQKNSRGRWVFRKKLRDGKGSAEDRFGSKVAIDSNGRVSVTNRVSSTPRTYERDNSGNWKQTRGMLESDCSTQMYVYILSTGVY